MSEAITHIDEAPHISRKNGGILIAYSSGGVELRCWMPIDQSLIYEHRLSLINKEWATEQLSKIKPIKRRRKGK